MKILFRALHEDHPGPIWQNLYQQLWANYRDWFMAPGVQHRPSYLQCHAQLSFHMPELLPLYERLCELAGGSDEAARFLSLYRPPAYISGCSQIILPHPTPRIVRNYDYSPRLLDGIILNSRWLGQRVMALSDCLIGVLDGMNESGLCLSLTFGGAKTVGDGFGIPIILRYILETCENAAQAEAALSRIPSHMAYNVSVIDRHSNYFTAHLYPGRQAIIVRHLRIATNHQPFDNNWQSYARATATLEREAWLQQYLDASRFSHGDIVSAFHRPPLFSNRYKRGFGTLYTSDYDSIQQTLTLHWPQQSWPLNLHHFIPGERLIDYSLNQ